MLGPLFKIGDLLMEERYPQGGTFVVVDVDYVVLDMEWRYKLAFEWGIEWVRDKFASECVKIG